MAKFLSIVISVFLLSACATVTEDNGSQVAIQELPTPAAEMQPVESNVPAPAEPVREVARKIPTKQEIKLMQAQLKAAGFDPGPVDGTLGAKTMSALRRLQSGCANLKDLFENPTSGVLSQPERMQAGKQSAADSAASNTDEIRLIQVRLKDAGFDVGPVDGVMGFKTKAAFVRFQSGCTMVKDSPAIFENQFQTPDRTPSPMSASEKQIQPTLKISTATVSVKDEAGRVNAAVDKSPGKEEIRLLQAQLKAAGFDPGPFDGMLGPKTKSALQQYRTVNGSPTSQKLPSSVGIKFDY